MKSSENGSRHPLSFRCQGEIRPKDLRDCTSCYFTDQELYRILDTSVAANSSCCQLFGRTIPSASVSTEFSDSLRCLTIRSVFALQNSSENFVSSISKSYYDRHSSNEFSDHRRHVCGYLNILKTNAKRILHQGSDLPESAMNIRNFLSNLKSLASAIGRISQIPEHNIVTATSPHSHSSSAAHCLFHLKLDFWWSLVALYHILDSPQILEYVSSDHSLYSRSDITTSDKLAHQVILIVIWDLVTLASFKFNKLRSSDYLKESIFHCTCVRELWVLLLQLVNFQEESHHDDSFWIYIHHISQDGIDNAPNDDLSLAKPEEFACSNPREFFLWLITNLAPLWQINRNGKVNPSAKGLSNYNETQNIVKRLLKSREGERSVDEGRLQFVLRCCLDLTLLWEPSIDLLNVLSSFYIKNMAGRKFLYKFKNGYYLRSNGEDVRASCPLSSSGNNFLFGNGSAVNVLHLNMRSGIEGHCLSRISGLKWSEEIMERVSRSVNWDYNDSSYCLFLMLVISQLQNCSVDTKLPSWRKVAERTFAKISERFISGLTELGLSNFLTFQLTLSTFADKLAIGDKLDSICRLVPMLSTKKEMTWKAMFALLHLYQRCKEDAAVATEGLADQFADTVRMFVASKGDNIAKRSLLKLILLYLEGVQDAFDCSPNLALSEHVLINNSFGHLLPHCGVSELSSVLSTVQHVILQLQSTRKNLQQKSLASEINDNIIQRHTELVNQLFESVLPFVETHAKTQTPPNMIAEIAAGLVLLISDGLPCTVPISKLVDHFGLAADVNPSISCDFLCHTISNADVIQKLTASQQISILSVWLRSTLLVASKSSKVEELGRLVSKLPEVSRQFPTLLNQTSKDVHHDFMAIGFFRSLLEQWNNSANVQEQVVLRRNLQHCLTPFLTELKVLMKGNPTAETTDHVLMLSGYLMFYCSPMLYFKGSPDSLFPPILDHTILPISLVTGKPLAPFLLTSCQENLHLYLQGLIQHNYRTDPYITRKIKDIIVYYLPLFPMNFISGGSPGKEKVDDVLLFMAESVCEKFLIKKGSNPSLHLVPALNFLSDSLKLTAAKNKTKLASFLYNPVFEFMLLPLQVSNSTKSRMEAMLATLLSIGNDSEESRPSLLECLRSFVERHLPWKTKLVFQFLDQVATFQPTLARIFMTELNKAVDQLERKRGVEHDKTLREGIHNLFKKLSS